PAGELRKRRRQGGQFLLELLVSLGRALARQRFQLLSAQTHARLHRLRGPPSWRGHLTRAARKCRAKPVRNSAGIRFLLIAPKYPGGNTSGRALIDADVIDQEAIGERRGVGAALAPPRSAHRGD